jgi:hypothetical protein
MDAVLGTDAIVSSGSVCMTHPESASVWPIRTGRRFVLFVIDMFPIEELQTYDSKMRFEIVKYRSKHCPLK